MCFLLQCDNELKYWVDGTRHGGENADYVAASQLDAVLSEVCKYQKIFMYYTMCQVLTQLLYHIPIYFYICQISGAAPRGGRRPQRRGDAQY